MCFRARKYRPTMLIWIEYQIRVVYIDFGISVIGDLDWDQFAMEIKVALGPYTCGNCSSITINFGASSSIKWLPC